jgi:hypothetical protein
MAARNRRGTAIWAVFHHHLSEYPVRIIARISLPATVEGRIIRRYLLQTRSSLLTLKILPEV